MSNNAHAHDHGHGGGHEAHYVRIWAILLLLLVVSVAEIGRAHV